MFIEYLSVLKESLFNGWQVIDLSQLHYFFLFKFYTYFLRNMKIMPFFLLYKHPLNLAMWAQWNWFSRTVIGLKPNLPPNLSSIGHQTTEIWSRKPDKQANKKKKQCHRTTNPTDPPLGEGSKKNHPFGTEICWKRGKDVQCWMLSPNNTPLNSNCNKTET